MPRTQTLLFAMKLIAEAHDAKSQLTQEEILEAFINVTANLKNDIDTDLVSQKLAELVQGAQKRNPNIVN